MLPVCVCKVGERRREGEGGREKRRGKKKGGRKKGEGKKEEGERERRKEK